MASTFDLGGKTALITGSGSGLGLPICKSLIEHHGGSLSLRSEPELGTTVTIELPAERIIEG